MNKKILAALGCGILISLSTFAQENKKSNKKEGSKYEFTTVKLLDATPVDSQGRTGTCWSFSTLSYIESELMRMGKGEHNLSEMWIVRKAYEDKARKYVRMHGKSNFDEGGAFVDIPHVIKKYGIVPQEVYKGLNYGTNTHNHAEMAEILKAMMDAVIKNPQRSLTKQWDDAISGVLDAYLGEAPEEFMYRGKKYTPLSFAASLEMNMDDYVSITSFTHEDFYTKFPIAVPDNWTSAQSYNLKLDEFMDVMDQSVMNGYTFAWGADVSEKGFSFRNGLAIVPENLEDLSVKGSANKNFSDGGAEKKSTAFEEPKPEMKITQEIRQDAYDNYETTDDHGMHAVGIVKDQNGTKYWIIKNSWGLKYNDCDGYFYASEAYLRYKTLNIMIHKDAIPKKYKKMLNIK